MYNNYFWILELSTDDFVEVLYNLAVVIKQCTEGHSCTDQDCTGQQNGEERFLLMNNATQILIDLTQAGLSSGWSIINLMITGFIMHCLPNPKLKILLGLLMQSTSLKPKDRRILKELCQLYKLAQRNGFDYETGGDDSLTLKKTVANSDVLSVSIKIIFPQDYPSEHPLAEVKQVLSPFNVKENKISAYQQLQQNWSLVHGQVNVLISSIIEQLINQNAKRWSAETQKITIQQPFIIERNYSQSFQRKLVNSSVINTQHALNTRRKEQSIQTKNLNRHFRSKLRQVLRELIADPEVGCDALRLYNYFKPNCVGFKEIRHVLEEPWFNLIIKEELRSGMFLARILSGIMGADSKLLMIKYYPIIEEAVDSPYKFVRWKN